MTQELLAGLKVVELGGGVAGGVAASLLADLGAAVIKVADPAVVARRMGPWLDSDGGPVPAIDAVLDRRKVVVGPGADIGALVVDADVVIVDAELAAPDIHAATAGRVRVTVTPFGLDGPRSMQLGGELIAQASGGLLGTIEGSDGSPVPAPGYVALRAAGACAALAALHGLDRHRTSGEAVHVDVSVQESVIATAALPECAHVLYGCPGKAGAGRYVAPSGLFPCRDGFVRITAVENHQWTGMCAALGSPEWTVGLEDRPARAEHAPRIVAEVSEWTRQREKAECADLLQRNGVPATSVNTPAELLASPQLAHRGSLVSDTIAGQTTMLLGPPWHWDEGEATSARRPESLADLRVTELTHVLAGPIVGALLGAMGARVTRVEDPDRLDLYRRTGPFAGGVPGVERGAYFAVANHSKRSVAIDPAHALRDVARVLESSDVLIENVGSSRLRRLGVEPAELAREGELTLRVSGFGATGPLAAYRVYANNVQSYGGLAAMTLGGDGEPARLGTVLADPLSSVFGAIVIAAWALGPKRDQGGVADLSMAEVVGSTVAEFAVADSLGVVSSAVAEIWRGLAPGADRRWVAVEAHGAAERESLLSALGVREEREIPSAIAQLEAQQAVQLAIDAGARAAIVVRGADLVVDAHLEARGFFPEITHPDHDLGTARIVGLPWRFAGEGPIPLDPPPALGSSSLQPTGRPDDR